MEYCLLCHSPNATDVSRRPAAALPPDTVNFKDMVHKIHSGENLSATYTVYGFGGTPHTYNEVRYPGDRRHCGKCHAADTHLLPLPEGLLATVISDATGEISRKEPITAACTACHDTAETAAHAQEHTVGDVEGCVECHRSEAVAVRFWPRY